MNVPVTEFSHGKATDDLHVITERLPLAELIRGSLGPDGFTEEHVVDVDPHGEGPVVHTVLAPTTTFHPHKQNHHTIRDCLSFMLRGREREKVETDQRAS